MLKKTLKEIFDRYSEKIESEYLFIQMFELRKKISLADIYITPRIIEGDSFEKRDDLTRGRYRAMPGEAVQFNSISPFEAGSHKIILGDPGAGKSSLLRMIVHTTMTGDMNFHSLNANAFPIYIELRRYAEYINRFGIASPEKYFLYWLFEEETDETPLLNFTSENRVIFLYDAFDEVPRDLQNIVSTQILSQISRNRRIPIIISSRIGEKEKPKGIDIYEISDFNDKERDEFILTWFRIAGLPERGVELTKAIASSVAIKEITTNPLLLSLICALYNKDIDLPAQRSEIFERCIQILIREWDTERQFRRPTRFSNLSDEKKINILSEIAYFYLQQSRRYFSEDDLVRFLENIQEVYGVEDDDVRVLINEICSHYGLIVPAGYSMLGFSHLSFQEYLSARYIVKHNSFDRLLSDLAENNRWIETAMFAAARIGLFGFVFDEIRGNSDLSEDQKFRLFTLLVGRSDLTIDQEYRGDLFNYIVDFLESEIQGNISIPQVKESNIFMYNDGRNMDSKTQSIIRDSYRIIVLKSERYSHLFSIETNRYSYDLVFLIGKLTRKNWFRTMLRDYADIQPRGNYKKMLNILIDPDIAPKIKVHGKNKEYHFWIRDIIEKF